MLRSVVMRCSCIPRNQYKVLVLGVVSPQSTRQTSISFGRLYTSWWRSVPTIPSPLALVTRSHPVRPVRLQPQQIRWKNHRAKMGQHLIRLDEMAHEKRHEEAVEKRQKKKEKEIARKSKKGKHDAKDKDATVNDEEEGHDKDGEDHEGFDSDEEEDHHEDEVDSNALPDPLKVKEQMHSVVVRFKESLKAIRGGEPTVELFDSVQVEAYEGALTSLQSVAQIVIVSPTLATATCFDPSVTKAVQHALYKHLELNANVDEDGVLRISLPRVTLETRQKLAKQLHQKAESMRQRVRQIRRKAMDNVKKGLLGKLEGVSKDDAHRVQDKIEEVTKEQIQELNEAADEKHDSIMQV